MNLRQDFALIFLVTYAEYKSGAIKSCLNQLFNKFTASKDNAISFYFVFNKSFPVDIKYLSECLPKNSYSKLKIHFLNIDNKDDVYLSRGKEEAKSELGLSAGPNSLFFGALNLMQRKRYKYFLCLETDVFALQDYWLDKILSFCNKNFLIAGSKYKGLNPYCLQTEWNHINGVAIYKNSKFLHDLVRSVKLYLINKIAEQRIQANDIGQKSWDLTLETPSNITNWFNDQKNNRKRNSLIMNYDVAIYRYCKEVGPDLFKLNNTNNKIMDIDLILDLSLAIDRKTAIKEVQTKFPKAVLCHKKFLKNK